MNRFSFMKWIQRWRRRKRYSAIHVVASMSDIPQALDEEIFVVGASGSFKWAVFDCPCRLGHTLTVNLMKSHWPRWKASIAHGCVSLRPSVIVDDHPCQSHFWLTANKVQWL